MPNDQKLQTFLSSLRAKGKPHEKLEEKVKAAFNIADAFAGGVADIAKNRGLNDQGKRNATRKLLSNGYVNWLAKLNDDLKPPRQHVAKLRADIVPKVADLSCAVVCDDAPLMYAIPRTNDCVFGGTNEITANLAIDPASTLRILEECSRILKIKKPDVLTERVGLRPFRRSGVRVERSRLRDGRTVIHNYGHGGAGFTLSWSCAGEVVDLAMLCNGVRRQRASAQF